MLIMFNMFSSWKHGSPQPQPALLARRPSSESQLLGRSEDVGQPAAVILGWADAAPSLRRRRGRLPYADRRLRRRLALSCHQLLLAVSHALLILPLLVQTES